MPASAIRFDDARKRIPLPTQTGNLIVELPGTRKSLGVTPSVETSNGGLDANWLVGRYGVPTVTFGAGQAEVHTLNECVDMSEFLQGCRLAVRLATQE